jgi:peptidyl-prolyl cis-trans isomerase B (cyclophilin B)
VASSKDRQRKLARAKLDRQMARRAAQLRRRRRIQAGAGAVLAILLIVGGVAWLSGAFDPDDKKATDPTAADVCTWTPQSAATNTDLKEVGTPPTKGMPTSGTESMTITTDQGAPIVVSLDLAKAPCSGADLSYLAGKKFYDNMQCHEITTEGALHCGDPAGNGLGGPTYSVYDENIPTAPAPRPSGSASPAAKVQPPLYPKGTVALIGNPPGTNGSQFLIFLKDFTTASPKYSIVGSVTGGAATLAKIATIPTVDNGSGAKVKPKEKITIKTLTVGTPTGADAEPSAAPSANGQS